jgi:hypothetical protein
MAGCCKNIDVNFEHFKTVFPLFEATYETFSRQFRQFGKDFGRGFLAHRKNSGFFRPIVWARKNS